MKKLIVTDDPIKGKRVHVPVDKQFEDILVSAVRYAIGRYTYSAPNTILFIAPLVPYLSDNAIVVLSRDIQRELEMAERLRLKMPYYNEWKMLKEDIDKEAGNRHG